MQCTGLGAVDWLDVFHTRTLILLDAAGQVSELQSKLAVADEGQRDAAAAVERLEGEMQDLAGAYNDLEVQSFQLQAHIKRLQNRSGSQLHQSGEAHFNSL